MQAVSYQCAIKVGGNHHQVINQSASRIVSICRGRDDITWLISVQALIIVQGGIMVQNYKRAGPNKRAVGNFGQKKIRVQVLIRPCRGENWKK